MSSHPDDLEKVIHRALRDLPPRTAPASLEARVLAEIARRAALPWWHRSLSYWPPAVRWLFLIVTAALCAATILGAIELLRGDSAASLAHVLGAPVRIVSGLWIAIRTTIAAGGDLIALIPRTWLYGSLAIFGLIYATLFAVGATAYRALWQPRSL